MKSAIISLVFLIFIFIAINSGALNVIGSSAFHYLSLIMLILVFVGAAFLIGFTPKETPEKSVDEENTDGQ